MSPVEQLAIQRDLGRMEAQIAALTEQVARLVIEVDALKTTLSERRGSWKVIASLSGLIGAIIAGVIVKLVPLIPWR